MPDAVGNFSLSRKMRKWLRETFRTSRPPVSNKWTFVFLSLASTTKKLATHRFSIFFCVANFTEWAKNLITVEECFLIRHSCRFKVFPRRSRERRQNWKLSEHQNTRWRSWREVLFWRKNHFNYISQHLSSVMGIIQHRQMIFLRHGDFSRGQKGRRSLLK
jgi:hypothetical protein